MWKIISKHGWVLGLAVLVSCGGDNPPPQSAALASEPAPAQDKPSTAEAAPSQKSNAAQVTPLEKLQGALVFSHPVELTRLGSDGKITTYEKKWFTGEKCRCKIQVFSNTAEHDEQVFSVERLTRNDKKVETFEGNFNGTPLRYSVIRLKPIYYTPEGSARPIKLGAWLQCNHNDPALASLATEDVLEAFGGSQHVSLAPPVASVN